MTRTITLAALAPVLLLGGCLSFGGEAPDSLLTLTPTATAPAGAGDAAAQGTALAMVRAASACSRWSASLNWWGCRRSRSSA